MSLRPYPFGALVRRALVEFDRERAIFGLPRRRWFVGYPGLDLSIVVHGRRIGTPFGPAAGPHTQLAQNIVLAWLAGGRAIELKTVQLRDAVTIPRPCIDMRTTGLNVEWSQELPLAQSLEEYVKASMLLRILHARGVVGPEAAGEAFVFDASLGYDLAGIRSDPMTGFVSGLLDARRIIDRLRAEIPPEFAACRDLDFDSRISRALTLSTFHGCPPAEIEAIVSYLQRRFGVDCTVKFNPTLLGYDRVDDLLHRFGYDDVRVAADEFENDLKWPEAVELIDRCGASASALGVGFGVKFTNTLVVENDRGFLPSDRRRCYMSGRPLHALAMELVRDFRRRFDDCYPIAFSAGIERWNFADCVGLGLKPVTVCTDLLREGGYARANTYFAALRDRMAEAGATTIGQFVEKSANAETYVRALASRPEIAAQSVRGPKKVRRELGLFDCLACDKCLPVCPNHALFAFTLAPPRVPSVVLGRATEGWAIVERREVETTRRHQIGVFADFCNECGNCDVFCPEHGGPYKTKPRFFGSEEAWTDTALDGLWVSGTREHLVVCGRIDGREYRAESAGGSVRFSGVGFEVTLEDERDDATRVSRVPALGGDAIGDAIVAVSVDQSFGCDMLDLSACALILALARAVVDPERVNYVNMLSFAPSDVRRSDANL